MIRKLFSRQKNPCFQTAQTPPPEKAPKELLENVLRYAHAIILNYEANEQAALFSLIKLLADKMTLDSALRLMTHNENLYSNHEESLFTKASHEIELKYDIKRKIRQALYENKIPGSVEISLSVDPIITFPWDKERFINAVGTFGSPAEPWKEDTSNHQITLLLPIGVCIVNGGNHSIFSGMLKRDGSLEIKQDSDSLYANKMTDISPLYELLEFNGSHYLMRGSGEVVGEAASFEFGCIFEIGRSLHERNICFKNLK